MERERQARNAATGGRGVRASDDTGLAAIDDKVDQVGKTGDTVIPRSRVRQTRMSSRQQHASANRLSQSTAATRVSRGNSSPRAGERRSHMFGDGAVQSADTDRKEAAATRSGDGGGGDGASDTDNSTPGAQGSPLSILITSLGRTGPEWAKTVMWWTEDFAHEFLAVYTHFVGHGDRTRLFVHAAVLWLGLVWAAVTDQSLISLALVAVAMWHLYALVTLPARRRRHADRRKLSGPDLMTAYDAVGRGCETVAGVVRLAIAERAETPAMFYAKCAALALVTWALARYWGATTTVALIGTAGLTALSGVQEW